MLGMKKIVCAVIIFVLASLYACAGTHGKSARAEQKSMTPGAPATLKLVIVPNGFKLTWKLSPQDPGKVTGYEIVRSDRASGPFTKVATIDKGVSEYIDTTAAPEIIYYYKVRAIAGTEQSPYSNTVAGER
jgi:hypothetical protein